VFQVDFDPHVIEYDDLLQLVWQSHDPTSKAFKTQYASLVLAHDLDQLEAARVSAQRLEDLFGRQIHTRIEPLTTFYMAEDYHQKYYLQNDNGLNREFRTMYPRFADFVESSAAARVNGYLAGAGACARLERELPQLGVSADSGKHLAARCK